MAYRRSSGTQFVYAISYMAYFGYKQMLVSIFILTIYAVEYSK